VPLSLGLLWTGWFTYGERNVVGLTVGVVTVIAGLVCVHIGLHAFPWPANLIAGLAILVAGGIWLARTEHFVASAARAEAVVVGFGPLQDATPVVRFSTPRQGSVEFTDWSLCHPKLKEDDAVVVLYDPAQPERASLEGFASL
jgi:hypothetical protein